MNILFVYSLDNIVTSARPLSSQLEINFGISYISSFLKERGHYTKLVVLSRLLGRKNKHIIDKYLKSFSPKLICFTAVATQYPFIKDIAKYIKDNYPDIYLLAGGAHVSLNPQEAILDDFDALCIGEGENPTFELVSQLAEGIFPSNISNLWIKHRLEIEKNSSRPFLQNLDSLPFPDREMWQEWILKGSLLESSILLGRGCPFQCAYCSNHALRKLGDGEYVRNRSVDNIVEELKEVLGRFPQTREIYLEVETISINKKWCIELCSALQHLNATLSRPLSFEANLRITPNAYLESVFFEFKKSNFTFLNIGLESGSERVRYEILKRNYSNQDVINTVKLARKYGLKINFYNLIGIPGETADDFKETVKINRICLPDRLSTSIFFPYPGTDLYALCKRQGLLKEPLDTLRERSRAVLDYPGFTKKQIDKSYIWFDYYVYRGSRALYKILIQVIRIKLLSNYYLDTFARRLGNSFLKPLKKYTQLYAR